VDEALSRQMHVCPATPTLHMLENAWKRDDDVEKGISLEKRKGLGAENCFVRRHGEELMPAKNKCQSKNKKPQVVDASCGGRPKAVPAI